MSLNLKKSFTCDLFRKVMGFKVMDDFDHFWTETSQLTWHRLFADQNSFKTNFLKEITYFCCFLCAAGKLLKNQAKKCGIFLENVEEKNRGFSARAPLSNWALGSVSQKRISQKKTKGSPVGRQGVKSLIKGHPPPPPPQPNSAIAQKHHISTKFNWRY